MAAPKANGERTVGADVLTIGVFPNPANWMDKSNGSCGSYKANSYIGTDGPGRAAKQWIEYVWELLGFWYGRWWAVEPCIGINSRQ